MSVSDWSVLKLLTTTTPFFQKKGIPSARLDAELLLAHVLCCSRVQLYTRFDQPLTDEELSQFRALVARRAAREPVAYLLGKKEFYGLEFLVGPGVLIPRPDTEILVEEALRLLGTGKKRGIERPDAGRSGTSRSSQERRSLVWNAEVQSLAEQERRARLELRARDAADGAASALEAETVGTETIQTDTCQADTVKAGAVGTEKGEASAAVPADVAVGSRPDPVVGEGASSEPRLVLDLCTGTAIIPICLAKEAGVRAIGVDLSPEALEYAKKNVELHALASAVALLKGDLAASVPARFVGRFELVTSNPPYLPPDDYLKLEPEIVKFEPSLALKGGVDGLELYVRMVPMLPRLLRPGGHVLLEVGTAEQGARVLALLERAGLTGGALLKDLAGLVRVVRAQKPVEARS